MAPIDELLQALDEMFLRAIKDNSLYTGGLRDLAEARAWLTHPDNAHGAHTQSG
jgi:hypothetical protein